ncbi:MAG: hypothetical protein IPJ76_13875 [Flavobacteriales bacterium]|nr:MAG: hypothetical protein IPJ76_13875 [Flavobacteriales bacterium]
MRTLIFSVLFISMALPSNAQNFFWDFEGPNGLDGWHNHDGTPLQTVPGAASNTSLRVQTRPPVGLLDSSAFIYHLVPYDPNVFYHVTLWQETPSPSVLVRAFLGWIDTLAPPPNVIFGSSLSGDGTTSWAPMEHFQENSIPGSGAFCICLSASSPSFGEIFFDNISIEMVPQSSVMMRTPLLFLGGAIVGSSMTTHLSDQGLVSLNEPYTALGYPQIGGGGGEWCTPMVLDPGSLNQGVDWVRVELRSVADPSVVLAARHLVLTEVGTTCDYNGQGMMSWNVPAGTYHVAVRHRNHLAAMTATAIALGHYYPTSTLDFRSTGFMTWGLNARATSGAYMVLWPGNTNGDGVVKYTGAGNDRDPILQAIGGAVPTNTVVGVYNLNDVNMDGSIKYTGPDNDRDPILQTVGGTVPTSIRAQQLP